MGVIALVFTSACTWKDAYNVAQSVGQPQCIYLADMQERQQCMKSRSMSYDAYEGERQRLRP
ncbi:hypothetical protein AKI39_15020 [Bordetella sp. H567]|nr:hypothetical protein AKI39_15020 [Bordetella sp. H567]